MTSLSCGLEAVGGGGPVQYTFAWHAWNMRVASDPSRIPNDLLTARLYCSSYAIIVVEKRKIFTGWH